MKKMLVFAAVAVVMFGVASCGVGGGRMQNDADSMAYAYGVYFGQNLRNEDSTLNANLVAKGVVDAFNKKSMSLDSAQQILNDYYTVKLPAKKQKEEVAYLESVTAKNPNAVKSESGLIYEIVMPGDPSAMPADEDEVLINYTGRLREGAEYDPNKEGKEFDARDSITFQLARNIAGFKEGMKLVGKGGKIRMWVPAVLAYGEQGNRQMGGPFGPFETLYFDVDLLDVIPPAPAEEQAPLN